MNNYWNGFKDGNWQQQIDVRNFIQENYTPYEGSEDFLVDKTKKTEIVWDKCKLLLSQEREKNGVLDVDSNTVSTITSHAPGYIDKDNEVIVGLQLDAPLKRGLVLSGGLRMAQQACNEYGYKLNPELEKIYSKYVKTHNEAVFSLYTPEMRKVRSLGLLTGLPDAYGRGRIIGDYRRIALYGIDYLIEQKQNDRENLFSGEISEEKARSRDEIAQQIAALKAIKKMAAAYGFDISCPAKNTREAVQWIYFGYLAAVKNQNGAAMSIGRVSTFIDIYIERDLKNGILTEAAAQEIIDQFVIKLRLIRMLRTPEYNELFAGDPLWVTEVIGGMGEDGRTLVTKTSMRTLHTLNNLGPAPEPNITILWSKKLPAAFKRFASIISIKTSAVQYENDEVMRPVFGDDYGIACCVSAMKLGKMMQFFGARANLAKALLLAINGGKDEKTNKQLAPQMPLPQGEYLDYDDVRKKYSEVLAWLAGVYVNTMNVIHYSHDRHAYEAEQMALHDSKVARLMAFGIAGLSVAVDSLSAIKYAKVKPIRDENGVAVDFAIEGDFPKYGNNDSRVDSFAKEITHEFITELKKHPAYRNAEHTLSILTITSNVVYGKKTGATPDGRKSGQPLAPGANPMHGRDKAGALAAMKSVANISYDDCRDGISYTFSIIPEALGKTDEIREKNLTALLDGYSNCNAHHINVNVHDRSTLKDAMEHPEKYPQLTIRVSGYAVNFIKLDREHQQEVIDRTFYEAI
ncbi:formate C-acetyltransferase [Pectinatus brassicae]|uniref:Formate acetyltransferase n=1 Tax=Pectinatus brassicae TaxID=862415 RepID=A0A840US68_9FIRM|nr:formate C-acetyltransferase [Pectinatus brassicae]MBB5335684.1 formate C-acetyltransferase [Pectinatus brassicae]